MLWKELTAYRLVHEQAYLKYISLKKRGRQKRKIKSEKATNIFWNDLTVLNIFQA